MIKEALGANSSLFPSRRRLTLFSCVLFLSRCFYLVFKKVVRKFFAFVWIFMLKRKFMNNVLNIKWFSIVKRSFESFNHANKLLNISLIHHVTSERPKQWRCLMHVLHRLKNSGKTSHFPNIFILSMSQIFPHCAINSSFENEKSSSLEKLSRKKNLLRKNVKI